MNRSTTSLFTILCLLIASPLPATAVVLNYNYIVEGQLNLQSGSDPLGLDGAGFKAVYTIDSNTPPSSIQSNRTNYLGQMTTVMINDPGGPADGTWLGSSPFIVPFRNPGSNNFLQLSDDLTVAGEPFQAGFFQIHFPVDDLFPPTGAIPLPLFDNTDVDSLTTGVTYGDEFIGDSTSFTLSNVIARSSPVPEPTTSGLAVLGFVLLARRRW